jgi:hypothetical protein
VLIMTNSSNFICLNPERDELLLHIEIGRGQTVLEPTSGTFMHVNQAGVLELTLAKVSSVEIVRNDACVTHQVRFCNGGTVAMSFDLLGNLTEFVGSAIVVNCVGAALKVSPLSGIPRVPPPLVSTG